MYEIIFASCGIILSNVLGLNLLYTYIQNINKEKEENIEYNILIFTILFYNSIDWIVYSLWFNNLFLFIGSLIVPIGSLMCIVIFYNFLSIEKKKIFTIIAILLYIFLIIYILLLQFINIDVNIKNSIVNYSLIFNIVASIMPLTSIITIIKNKSTKTLYIPFTVINIVSSILWLNYGILLNNYFLIFIFAFGIFTSIIEIFIYTIFNTSVISYKNLYLC